MSPRTHVWQRAGYRDLWAALLQTDHGHRPVLPRLGPARDASRRKAVTRHAREDILFHHGPIARIVRRPDLARGERECEPAAWLEHACDLGDGPLRVRPEDP
ncbi:MAG TPA: hypothetical protein VE965_01850 [Gammaproteobacteria bacterium]|nr:hypothetical protein [Gammaproteobacteria bacterium]